MGLFVDRHPEILGGVAVLLILMSLADGLMTLILIESPDDEANPAMAFLIRRGAYTFLGVKYLITVFGAAFLLSFRTFLVFGGRLQVARLLPAFVGLYALLLIYQMSLAWSLASRDGSPQPGKVARSR